MQSFCEISSSQVVQTLDYEYSEENLNYALDHFSVKYLYGDEKDLVVDSVISVDNIFGKTTLQQCT